MDSTMDAALGRWALELAGRGWPVLPLRPGAKFPDWHRGDRCPGTGQCRGGHRTPEQIATTDPDLITAAWSRAPWNVGVFPGPAGLLIIDCDPAKPGPDELDGWTALQVLAEQRGGPLPDTFTVTTPRGGRHLYYRAPAGCALRSTQGHLAAAVDTRGWGGYAVAPGSVRADGAYELLDDTDPVELPGWLVQANVEHCVTAGSGRGDRAVAVPGAFAATAVRGECGKVAATPYKQGRNKALSRAAYALGQLVGADVLAEDVARTELRAAVDSWGDVASIAKDYAVIETSLRAGRHNPRRITPHSTRTAGTRRHSAASPRKDTVAWTNG
ncbi:bifunctional DNA primase/polymerase-like protein [Amycolatopsis sulphurea]|uniref:Bifunctional DNA primase/polymerase-like protein n=1 Tax=Amycolatopsis sulphurea TaxID=76022 RepID=A0A2A9G2C4_9PSEU|nr:bifunctional DNA primase/polymerase [Amycolatopsis sulphurea]PFG56950.1 bifunctional DNA primase/polymerase-like protein [Amycolatopsis sulphurea]